MLEDNDRPGYEPPDRPAPEDTPGHRLNPLQRLWTAFTSPGEVFADILRKPAWVTCLVALVALGVALQFVIIPHVDTEATLRLRLGDRIDDVSKEQLEQIVEQGQRFAIVGPIATLVIGPIVWAIIAGLFFVMLKIVGSDTDYLRILSTTLHAYWPAGLVAAVLNAVLIQRVGEIPQQEITNVVKSHLGAFLPPETPAWQLAAASTINVFNLWTITLLVIGFTIVGRVPRARAVIAALVPWVIYLAAKTGFTAIFT